MPTIPPRLAPRSEEIVAFVDDPDGRGTVGLIWSCLLTLALCVWSALHLNIPGKHDTQIAHWSRVLRWVLLGILAPELVLWAAWRQWTSAAILTKEIQRILKDKQQVSQEEQQQEQRNRAKQVQKREYEFFSLNPHLRSEGMSAPQRLLSEPPPRRHEWTRLHSFYVCMGGLVFDIDDSALDGVMTHFPRTTNRRITLTTRAAILLAECGYLPDIDPDDIKDKSKADSLAKAIVLLQASWFLVQAIARLAQGLPVSLLEVNTIGHVLCALVMYLLWWNKPREVGEPTVLRGSWVNPLCSFMYMSSRISGAHYRGENRVSLHPSAWTVPELENLNYIAPEETSSTPSAILPLSSPSQRTIKGADIPQSTGSLIMSEYGGFKTVIRRQDTSKTAARKRKLGWNIDDRFLNEPASSRHARHRFCAQAIQTYPDVRKHFERKGANSCEYAPKPQQFLVPTAMNYPSDFLLRPHSQSIVGIVLWLVSIMYGSVHLAAWNENFPSRWERLLWHLSAGFICASGVWWLAAHVIFYMSPWMDDWWARFLALKNHWSQYVVYGFLMGCAGTLYILTRAYLTVEGIVSLRAAPAVMYDTVNWSNFIPHF